MTLRKITIENSVKFFPKSEQIQSISRERDSKQNTIKNSLPCKQNKKSCKQNKKNNRLFFAKFEQKVLK